MSSKRTPPGGQLDMPLVWELEPRAELPSAPDDPFPVPPAAPEPAPALRLAVAALADLGGVLLCLAATATTVVALGAGTRPGQLLLAVLAGAEVALLGLVAVLWAWRGTPGMLLANAAFASPLPLSTSVRLSLWWLLALPVAGLPLLLGRRGARPIERLAGATVSFRSPLSAS